MIQPAKSISLLLSGLFLISIRASAQDVKPVFTRADTLRGSMNAERNYNVIKYDISFTPDFENKSIRGQNTITYTDSGLNTIQIDLQMPLEIDSILQEGTGIEI